MPDIDAIRRMDREGASVAEISRRTGHDPKTVRKYVDMDDFSPDPPERRSRPSILDPYKPFIDEILREDAKVWRKQRHSTQLIFERLQKERGYKGGLTTVGTYVAKRRSEIAQGAGAFLDLEWAPGTCQGDFGDCDVMWRGEIVRMHALVASLPASNAGWPQLFAGQSAECVCQGLWNVFRHIGGVPPLVILDNATGAGRRGRGGTVTETELFTQFRLHCRFEVRFCNPGSGHEKGNVERQVAYMRDHTMVPVPEVSDLAAFNEELLARADAINAKRDHYRKGKGVAELLERDLAALLPLPKKPFIARRWVEVSCDKWGEATLEGAHTYDVSPEWARRRARVEIDAYRVTFQDPDTGDAICSYVREFGEGPTHARDPFAQLRLLAKRPGGYRESSFRSAIPKELKERLDGLERAELASELSAIQKAAARSGARSAVDAAARLAGSGRSLAASDVYALARRIAAGDEATDVGIDLAVYDRALLEGRR